ncbi:MAG TPA: helix-turn-helix transcriptional regulator [Bdellovibrionota bacterium]|jgi:transcriptional regulator with XRE-family HTH domain|nr:helix-turn-helix transcriptional regulator [Bdellovibrionota bacterium]
MKRGRPKGSSRDNRSHGPLADLIRGARLRLGLGLADVARSCGCSIQFISNIEHGRAPVPWDKAPPLARALGIPLPDLKAANMSVRADFQSFLGAGKAATPGTNTANLALTLTAADTRLRKLLEAYREAPEAARRKFHTVALRALNS